MDFYANDVNLVFCPFFIFHFSSFQSMDMYKNEEIEYQLAQKQECFV